MRYLLRRLGGAVLTLWLAFTLAFVALRIVPGDAISAQLVSSGASQQEIAARRTALGLDQPIPAQYVQALGNLLHGDLGYSILTGRTVAQMIGEQFAATVELAVGGIVVAVLLGIGMGAVASLSSSGWLRGSAFLLSSLSLSSPVYWTGTLAIYFFSVQLRVLPSTGTGDVRHLILPCTALGISLAGSIARVTMANLDQTRRADFVRTARSKGLRERTIAMRHILRASLGPILAVIALQTGFLLGGVVITESLFVRQGIGQVLLDAINGKDYPVVQGIVVLSAIVYSLSYTVADLLTAAFDPRIRLH